MAWIYHGKKEYLSTSDKDDVYYLEHENYYINDIDVMLEAI